MNPIKIALGAVETLNVQTKSFLSEDGRLAQFSWLQRINLNFCDRQLDGIAEFLLAYRSKVGVSLRFQGTRKKVSVSKSNFSAFEIV